MRKIILMFAILLAMSFLMAQERYTADISYYDLNATPYYTQVPRTITAGTYTVVGTRFTPLYPVTLLNGINVRISTMLAGAPSGVKVEIYAVDAVTHLPTGFALASVTKAWASLTLGAWNFFDFSASGLSFAAGQEFFAAQSCPNGSPGATWYGPYLNQLTAAAHSYRFYTSGTATGWVGYLGEWHMSANVNYNAPFHDVSASSLWFSGDLLLPPGASISYEADVENTGDQDETNVPVTIEISDITYPARTVLYTNTQIIPSLLAGATAHVTNFPAYQYNTAGEYIVTLRTGLTSDMDATNNMINLEQQVVVLPTTLTYDDGTPDGAWAPNVGGNYFLNEFECPVGPVLVTDLHFYIWPNTWPSPGSTTMGISVFDDDGFDADGNPCAPGTEVYSARVDCTQGAWNTYNIANSLVMFSSGKFFVGFKTLADYPNCPGLAVDNSGPHSAWKVSWESSEGLWYQSYPEYDMDWMIRASVDYVGFWPPENLSVTQMGNDILLDWEDVDEASYYHVYSGITPYTITTPLGAEVGVSNYTDVNGAAGSKKFYSVKAVMDAGAKSYSTDSVIKKAAAFKLNNCQQALKLAD